MDLVADLWSCVVQDEGWQDWLLAATRLFDGVGATLGLVDGTDCRVTRLVGSWTARPEAEDYRRHWHAFDPQTANAAAAERSRTYVAADHVDRGDPDTDAYMRWSIGAVGYEDHLGAVVLLGEGRHRAAFCVHRATGSGPVPDEHRRRLDAMLPALSRAFELGFSQSDLLTEAFWRGVAASERTRAVLLLDERGRVLRKTAAADALLASGRTLRLAAGRLASPDPAADGWLARAVARAVRPADARGGEVALPRSPPARPLLAAFAPVPWRTRPLAPAEAAAVVRITDPDAALRLPAGPVERLFGASRREAELAALLVRGHSVESAAVGLGVSIATARTHLRNLFAKTRTTRQSELLLLLSQLGADAATGTTAPLIQTDDSGPGHGPLTIPPMR